MRRGKWRSKILFMLIIYFAGFATAIYVLAPGDVKANKSSMIDRGIDRGLKNIKQFKSDDFFNEQFTSRLDSGMRRCMHFANQNAAKIGDFLKAKLSERNFDDAGEYIEDYK